jgi:hypothetical protein
MSDGTTLSERQAEHRAAAIALGRFLREYPMLVPSGRRIVLTVAGDPVGEVMLRLRGLPGVVAVYRPETGGLEFVDTAPP